MSHERFCLCSLKHRLVTTSIRKQTDKQTNKQNSSYQTNQRHKVFASSLYSNCVSFLLDEEFLSNYLCLFPTLNVTTIIERRPYKTNTCSK